MGGLRKKMPITFICWILSTAALCGIPFFSGFFSKDEIIDGAEHNGYQVFYIVGLIGAFMTAAYMTRATYLTFFGEARGAAAGEHHDAEHAHDLHDAGISEEASRGGRRRRRSRTRGGARRRARRPSRRSPRAPRIAVADHGAADDPRRARGRLRLPERGAQAVRDDYFTEWVEARGEPVAETEPRRRAGRIRSHCCPARRGSRRRRGTRRRARRRGLRAGTSRGRRASASRSTTIRRHAEFKWSKALTTSIPLALGGIVDQLLRVPGALHQATQAVRRSDRTQRRRRAPATGSCGTSTTSIASTRRSSSSGHRADRRRRRTGSTRTSSTASSTAPVSSSRKLGGWIYRNIDQRVVDGAVNGSGAAARGSGRRAAPRAVRQGQPVRGAAVRRSRGRRPRPRHREQLREQNRC